MLARIHSFMLIGIDPLLGPEALSVLRAMGHGDLLVLADANFPTSSCTGQVVRMDGVDLLLSVCRS